MLIAILSFAFPDENHDVALPRNFRAVLYADVFGWFGNETKTAGAATAIACVEDDSCER
jgi:hypothetical protein